MLKAIYRNVVKDKPAQRTRFLETRFRISTLIERNFYFALRGRQINTSGWYTLLVYFLAWHYLRCASAIWFKFFFCLLFFIFFLSATLSLARNRFLAQRSRQRIVPSCSLRGIDC